ncbi:hypothetical protein H6F88_02265 [Oculatella sp. FACHB-28]|uniref:hypothetical protein n=1 Tax=Oculatella sp. FACHB-28 TaxID=2692845 RepID=UPI0016898FCB|nr:hypothetical protein [Oculatella sp. FACHB-28]MBD2054860.1 hypothetical protein [Oculatella sp. FACHB-28]
MVESESSAQDHPLRYDPAFRRELERLHRLTVYGRWGTVCLLWLLLAPLSLWSLRSEFVLWMDYFTWTAVRYTIAYNPIQAFFLSLCIGITVAVLLWQSRNILWGISDRQTKRLEKQLLQIRQQGPSHPLWRWVTNERSAP